MAELQLTRLLPNLLGASGAAQRLQERIATCAANDVRVLITGEPGTGKTLVARAIYDHSPRVGTPFVTFDCGAWPARRADAELFGGGISIPASGVLLVEDGDRLNGETRARLDMLASPEMNVRLLMTATRELEPMPGWAAILVPPLRERRGDVPILVDHFCQRMGRHHRKAVTRVSTEALDALVGYSWPGNVRELEHVLDRAVLLCDSPVLQARHLPATVRGEATCDETPLALEAAVVALEARLIREALKSAHGNRARAARRLETTERILNYKMKKLGIDLDEYRA